MGNLDWGSKFLLDMSQNRGERKSSTLYREINFAFDQKIHFFDEIDQKLKIKKKKSFFFKSYNFYKTQNSQFWLLVLLCINIGL